MLTELPFLPEYAAAGADICPPVDESNSAARRSQDLVQHLQQSEIYRSYEQAFQATTGLPLALRAVGSFHRPLAGSKYENAFCALMAKCNKSCAACLRLQQRVESAACSETKTLECYNGLSESAVPIHLGEEVIGYLQTGQVMFRRPSNARFRKATRQLAKWGAPLDMKKLEAAYFQTRVIGREQYEAVLKLLMIFAKHLGAVSNQVMLQQAATESPMAQRARAYIVEHQHEEISLREVASAVNMSPFYFCKTFKQETGLTFTDFLARLRIENVKNILLNPHKRISEAAFAAGFQSLSQFNRVFHRITDETPKSYRARLHPAA